MSGSATVQAWAEAVARFADEWPKEGAAAAAERIEQYVAADTGGDGRLSRYRGGSAEVAIEGGSGESSVMADGSLGLWAILEEGTDAHEVHARGRYLRTPFGPRRFVLVGGVEPRGTWTKGAAAGFVEAERTADAMFGELS